ncbi:helix-turn-helix domain-containing protein [Aneurinibacillus migulanus]|uniref:helix-turn-helix domain-containing protein n=1 Tax=Aneurinibacillus migulanus TaxID=47500 RepID=UPI002E1A3EF0|nr:helix-turn-helix domain-containing protein [Aneurinibacillus migulanus]MED4731374.1 helix-turn-helix domain-containing protein [Aneurinibacillus migulanus]
MYSIQLVMKDEHEKKKLKTWIQEEYPFQCVFTEREEPNRPPDILIIEIGGLFDWVRIHRIRKRNKECRIFPLIPPEWLHTSPLAIELKLQSMLVHPIKRNLFMRNIKRAIESLSSKGDGTFNYKDIYEQIQIEGGDGREDGPFREAFLRRLLRGEISTEQEIIQTRPFLPGEAVPNIVCFIQGFVRFPEREVNEGWEAPAIIQKYFTEQFSVFVPHLFFLPYRKHMVMLFRVPSPCASLRYWKEGHESMLRVIEKLEEKYGIYLYIGVGSVYREPLLLHHSYREGRKARRTPPYERLSLRYYEELTKDEQLQKCIDYIGEHYTEDLSATQVAAQINLSAPYFSRLFKKETGRSFVYYVTFVRMQRAVWLLRHTNQTIEQIAEELGFNTPNYFSCIFKKYAGLAPSEYRATKEIIFM